LSSGPRRHCNKRLFRRDAETNTFATANPSCGGRDACASENVCEHAFGHHASR
jgi:hypothetical protein